jgi:hypothetical protein
MRGNTLCPTKYRGVRVDLLGFDFSAKFLTQARPARIRQRSPVQDAQFAPLMGDYD